MNAIDLLRLEVKQGHDWLEGTVADVTTEQAHWTPPGIANPIGATYAHLVISEDMLVQGMLKQGAPLFASSWAGKTGLSEPMPLPGPDWAQYGPWAHRVQVDLPAVREYSRAVYAATDEYLASLSDADLDRALDLSGVGMGQQTLGWVIGLLIVNHIGTETGEIACLKGIQGAKGYPA